MAPAHEPPAQNPASAGHGAPIPVRFHRHGDVDGRYELGSTAKEILAAFNCTVENRRSQALLVWPQSIRGLAVIHALAALTRLPNCDEQRLTTLFFPWNRNSGSTQKALLVDREQLVEAARAPLNRIHTQSARQSAFGYLMAIHSLKHVSKGEPGNRRYKAVEQDPSLLYPTLFELMPQAGIQASETRIFEDHFLRRLRRHTWINERSEHIASANDPVATPFFLFGLHADALNPNKLSGAGLDPDRAGRSPDIVLVDLTRRARNTLGENWRTEAERFFLMIRDFYNPQCPPAFVVTDDVFTLQTVRWKMLKEYEAGRGIAASPKAPAPAHLIINLRADMLDAEKTAPAWLEDFGAEVYGSDLLQFVESGLKLRRSLLDAGDTEIAAAVSSAMAALQNFVGLPGPVRWFREFLVKEHEGYEMHRLGDRFDHLAPRGKIATAIRLGTAGASHAQLAAFLKAYDTLVSTAASDNPGTRFFEDCLAKLNKVSHRSLIVFSSELIRSFAQWRVETETHLQYARQKLGTEIVFACVPEIAEELSRAPDAANPYDHIVFIEPYPDDLLKALVEPDLPHHAMLLCHLARAQQIVDRARALRGLDGVAPVEWNLLLVQERLEKVMAGHTAEIPDFEAILLEPRVSTIDLAGPRTPSSGPTRMIRTSGYVRIRAFEGTELAVYDPDALPAFSKRRAKDLKPGDQICVFTPDFVDAAREKLHLSATAPEVLGLYHKAVGEAAAKLPGRDINAKADALREAIIKSEPSLAPSLPGAQAMRNWIDVDDLLKMPRDQVRPQAPRDPEHFFAFMKVLAIGDDLARLYWDLGVFWTRSARISRGSAFHQVFMGILIDPHGTVSRFPEEIRQEVWRIHETAEEYLVTVVANDAEGHSK